MPEEPRTQDPGVVWRDQPKEERPVTLEQFMNRRTRELYFRTRSEILVSLGAAVFFIAVVAWRLMSVEQRVSQLGIAAVLAWVVISLYWFRSRIWRKDATSPDAVAATGLEYYRKELERRRDHLRNVWLWNGPLFLACLVLVGVGVAKAFPGWERLRNVAPLVVLLAAWTGLGIWRRRRQAEEVQREIDELEPEAQA